MNKEKSLLTNPLFVFLCGGFCCFLWGSATPTIKIGYQLFSIAADDTPSIILFAGIRFLFAGICTLIAGSLIQKTVLVPKSVQALRMVIVLGLIQTVLQYFFFYSGLTSCPGVKSSVILATNVFTSLLVAALLYKQEKLTWLKIAGCVIGFTGVVLITVLGKEVDYKLSFHGEGFIFLSSVSYGFSGSLVKIFSKKENTVMLSGAQFVFGGIVMIVYGLLGGGHIEGFTAASVVLLGYLVFISAVAYTLWGILLKYNEVSRVAVCGFLNPVFGVILSTIFLNEKGQTGIITVVSLLLVCFGIYIVNKKGKPEAE